MVSRAWFASKYIGRKTNPTTHKSSPSHNLAYYCASCETNTSSCSAARDPRGSLEIDSGFIGRFNKYIIVASVNIYFLIDKIPIYETSGRESKGQDSRHN